MVVVHIITRLNQGGTSTWLNNLLSNHFKNFEQVICFGNIDRNEKQANFYKNHNYVKLRFLGRKISPFKDLFALLELIRVIQKLQPNVINTHTFKAGVIGRLATKIVSRKIDLVHTYHGHLLYGYSGKIQSFLYKKIEIYLSKITDLYIVNGNQTKIDLINSKIINSKKSIVIHPGLVKDFYPSKDKLRKKYKLNNSHFAIGWLGRFTDVKDPLKVVEIAKKLQNYLFIMGGDGDLKQKLMNKSPKNIKFVGWVDPDEFWQICEIALLTSKNEATPYALVEAAKHSLPIVTSKVGAVGSIATKSNSIFAHTIEEFCTAIKELNDSRKLRIHMGKNSRKIFLHNFTLENFLRAHDEVYRSL